MSNQYLDLDISEAIGFSVLGMTYPVYQVEFMPDGFHDADGTNNLSSERVMILKHLPDQRKSLVIWHEIVHIVDKLIHIKDDGKELSEEEVDRIACAISTLNVRFQDNWSRKG